MKIINVIFLLPIFFCISCATSANKDGNNEMVAEVQDTINQLDQIKQDSIIVKENPKYDADFVASYYDQLIQYLSEHHNSGKEFGDFEKEHFLDNKNSIYPVIVSCDWINGYYLLQYSEGEDCERAIHYLVVDYQFGVVDKLVSDKGGCDPDLAVSDIFHDNGDAFKKDTIGDYSYFVSMQDQEIRLVDDNILFAQTTVCYVKNMVEEKYLHAYFNDTTLYAIDTTGHFQVVRDIQDSFSVDEMLRRME